jgi:hypothetical protein
MPAPMSARTSVLYTRPQQGLYANLLRQPIRVREQQCQPLPAPFHSAIDVAIQRVPERLAAPRVFIRRVRGVLPARLQNRRGRTLNIGLSSGCITGAGRRRYAGHVRSRARDRGGDEMRRARPCRCERLGARGRGQRRQDWRACWVRNRQECAGVRRRRPRDRQRGESGGAGKGWHAVLTLTAPGLPSSTTTALST